MIGRRALLGWLVQLVVLSGVAAAASVPGGWPLVHITDPLARHVTIQALEAASRWLREEDCRQILMDFPEHEGFSLADRLSALSVDFPTYLTMLTVMDDSRHRYCDTGGVIAFTVPGSRVIRVCAEELKQMWTRDPEHTIAALIHEVLHTLGLRENPPSSGTITARVHSRCAPSKKQRKMLPLASRASGRTL